MNGSGPAVKASGTEVSLEEFQHPLQETNQGPQDSIENVPPFDADYQLVSLVGV